MGLILLYMWIALHYSYWVDFIVPTDTVTILNIDINGTQMQL